MRGRRVIGLVALAFGAVFSASAWEPSRSAVPDVFGYDSDTLLENRITGADVVSVAKPLPTGLFSASVSVQVEVNTDGGVSSATLIDTRLIEGLDLDPIQALDLVKSWRFRPFEWHGHPVKAVAWVGIGFKGQKAEKTANSDVQFPKTDGKKWTITLKRTGCYGSCPSYTVAVSSDGTTVFDGEGPAAEGADALRWPRQSGAVLLPGKHIGKANPADVAALLKDFENAAFFGLDNEYTAHITDNPTYSLTVQVGYTSKTVIDYVGESAGMPHVVTILEKRVDDIGQTARWLTGDSATATALAAERFEFTGDKGRDLLLRAAVRKTSDEFIVDLIRKGVSLEAKMPVSAGGEVSTVGAWLTATAASQGRSDLFAFLKSRHWLNRTSRRNLEGAFTAGSGCDPDIARDLAAAGARPSATDENGRTALINILYSDEPCHHSDKAAAAFGHELISLGVPVNLIDEDGDSAIFDSRTVSFTEMLLLAGARVDLRNKEGLSPAWSVGDDRTLWTLLEAGADPSGKDTQGRTLRQTLDATTPASLAWLDAHHVP